MNNVSSFPNRVFVTSSTLIGNGKNLAFYNLNPIRNVNQKYNSFSRKHTLNRIHIIIHSLLKTRKYMPKHLTPYHRFSECFFEIIYGVQRLGDGRKLKRITIEIKHPNLLLFVTIKHEPYVRYI